MALIAVAGDVYPGAQSGSRLKAGDAQGVFGDLLPEMERCDLRLVNLEGPFVRALQPISKIGPVHAIEEACIAGLKAAGIDVFNLGNNHIMDHGPAGLQNTLRLCALRGIDSVGAAENVQAAGRPLIRDVQGVRVGILSYVEQEFCIARDHEWGAHAIDVMHFVRCVQTHSKEWDILLVLLHAGNEYYAYPRPSLRDTCRFMVEQGADAVICQQSHCPGCHEAYDGGQILYGQGNFLFENRSSHACENEGLLVILDVVASGISGMKLVPFSHVESPNGPRKMKPTDSDRFLKEFAARSAAILEPDFVEAQWALFCRGQLNNYLAGLQTRNRRIRDLNHHINFLRLFYPRERLRLLMHLMRCESHREAIISAIESELKGVQHGHE